MSSIALKFVIFLTAMLPANLLLGQSQPRVTIYLNNGDTYVGTILMHNKIVIQIVDVVGDASFIMKEDIVKITHGGRDVTEEYLSAKQVKLLKDRNPPNLTHFIYFLIAAFFWAVWSTGFSLPIA